MDALIGIYIVMVLTSLIASLIYIWYTIPHWSSLVEDDLHRQLAQAKQIVNHLELAIKTAEEELAPLKKRDEEITLERYNRGYRDFPWQS